MIDRLRHATPPHSYWLVWCKQDFLWTDFTYLSVNRPVHTYAASKPISPLLAVVLRSRRLTQMRWSFCSFTGRFHNSTCFVERQLVTRQKSVAKHKLFLEEIKVNFSSLTRCCLTKLVAQIRWSFSSSAYGLTVRSDLSMLDSFSAKVCRWISARATSDVVISHSLSLPPCYNLDGYVFVV